MASCARHRVPAASRAGEAPHPCFPGVAWDAPRVKKQPAWGMASRPGALWRDACPRIPDFSPAGHGDCACISSRDLCPGVFDRISEEVVFAWRRDSAFPSALCLCQPEPLPEGSGQGLHRHPVAEACPGGEGRRSGIDGGSAPGVLGRISGSCRRAEPS